MQLGTEQFDYNPQTRTFTAEISSLTLSSVPKQVTLFNPKTGNKALFAFSHTDMDGSGEDAYGWNYKVTMGAVQDNPALANCKILLIND